MKSYFGFNLNKTLNCLATHLVSHCSHTYPKLTLSFSLAHALRNKHTHRQTHRRSIMCTHAHTKGSYQAAVCLKCCFYIAAIFHFGLVSLNCLWGFVWVEEPSHLYMRLKEKKERWETCLCSYSFSLPPSYSLYAALFSDYVSFPPVPFSFFLSHVSLTLSLSLFSLLSACLSPRMCRCARWACSNSVGGHR